MAILKVATYEGKDFYDKICKYSINWFRAPGGFRRDVDKFALLQTIDSSRVILSVSQNHYWEPNMPYNCIFHSTSIDPLAAKKVLDDFINITGFVVKDAPPHLEKLFDKIDDLVNLTTTSKI